MTYQEPERLALQLQQLLERRGKLRAILEQALGNALTAQERRDILRVLDLIDRETASVEQRLETLRSIGGGGTD